MEAGPRKAGGADNHSLVGAAPTPHFTGLSLTLPHWESKAQSPVTLTVFVLLATLF